MEENLLQRLERMMREGQLLDPRTTKGLVAYTVLGLGIGWLLGMMF